jgi:hypothetical protein
MGIYESQLADRAHRHCKCCGRLMLPNHPQQKPTRDHIRPRAWGGENTRENLRVFCRDCNQLRAMADHCLGALACARAIAFQRGGSGHGWLSDGTRKVLMGWLKGAAA